MYILGEPRAELRGFIERYWFVVCPTGEHFDLAVDVYVDGQADMVINHGVPYRRVGPNGGSVAVPFSSIDAQRTGPVRIEQRGNVQVCGARFTVGGLAVFTDTPMWTLTDRIVPIAEVFGRAAGLLTESLRRVRPDTDAMGRLLDAFFLQQLSIRHAYRVCTACMKAIDEALPVGIAVSSIASTVGISARTMQRAFAQVVGLTPGFYLRVARFQRALHDMMDRPAADLGRVAQEAGFYDQPHLIREFHALAGGIPKQYRGYLPSAGRDFAPNVVTYRQ